MKASEITKSLGKAFKSANIYKATVRVKLTDTPTSVLTNVTILANNPQMAKSLLQTQYGKNSVISNVIKVK